MIFLFIATSCNEKFVFFKQPYNGKNLKIGGYYYNINQGVETDYCDIYFLYRDGTLYKGGSGSFEKSDIPPDVQRIDTLIYKNVLKNSLTNWGIFKISNDQIEYDMRYSRIDATVYRNKGVIINDSTFIINSVSKTNGKDVKRKNDIYHFHSFHPKPDSTNKFIK